MKCLPEPTVSSYVVEILYRHGIDTYFTVTGGSIVPLLNAVSLHSDAQYYCFQHEQAAAMAAEGFYRATGRIAAVCVTSGPGVQNILNGICGCWYDSIPAIFICGQVSTLEGLDNFSCKPRQAGFQEMPVCGMFSHVSKACIRLESTDKLTSCMRTLLKELYQPRFGPVVLDLPVNLQMNPFAATDEDFFITDIPSRKTCGEYVHIVQKYIEQAKRPLLVFGHGVRLAGAAETAIQFAERTNTPFVLTWGAADLCSTQHPLRVGMIGVYGDRHANFAIQNADLLIIIGARMDTRQTGGNIRTFSQFSRKIMVDVDVEEILKLSEKGIQIHESIVDDAYNFFESVRNYTRSPDINKEWHDTIFMWKVKYSNEIARISDPMAYNFMKIFFAGIPDDGIVITDIGSNMVWTLQSTKLKSGQRIFSNFGNASMGVALPLAIGAAIGSKRKIYVVAGDGGFHMTIQELQTVKNYDLPISICVLDNSGYGMIKQFQDSYFASNHVATSKTDIYGESEVDFASIATAYGIDDIQFMHVKVPESQRIYPKLEFGDALENMTPYIDSEEDMIVPVPPKRKPGWVNN